MTRRRVTFFVTVVSLAGLIGPLQAGQATSPTAGSKAARTATKTAPRVGLIKGEVLDAIRKPVPFARVHLRDVDNGAIMDWTAANHLGEFLFTVPGRGMYMAELYDVTGKVVAASEAMVVLPGQTVGTTLLIPNIVAPLPALFGASAAPIISAASAEGVEPVSSSDPVSPEE